LPASLSIIIPALNEEGSLEQIVQDCLRALRDFSDGEVVIVNDGSTDNTPEIADRLSMDPRVSVLHHQSNLGIGTSVRDALSVARMDFITFLPADGQIDPFELNLFLPLLDTCDIIVSTYFHSNRGIFRESLSLILRWLMRVLLGFSVQHEGIYLARTSLIRNLDLQSETFFLSFEIIAEILEQGGRLGQTQIHVLPRYIGRSKVVHPRKIYAVFREILSYRKRKRSRSRPERNAPPQRS